MKTNNKYKLIGKLLMGKPSKISIIKFDFYIFYNTLHNNILSFVQNTIHLFISLPNQFLSLLYQLYLAQLEQNFFSQIASLLIQNTFLWFRVRNLHWKILHTVLQIWFIFFVIMIYFIIFHAITFNVYLVYQFFHLVLDLIYVWLQLSLGW